jgi:hypothetical protein
MTIFLSYSSSGLEETRELLRALERSFGGVDWIGNGLMSSDNVEGRYLLSSGRAAQLDDLIKACTDSKVILLVVSPAFEMRDGVFDDAQYLMHAQVDLSRALNRKELLQHFGLCLMASDYCSASNPVGTLQSRVPVAFPFLRSEFLAPPEDFPTVMQDCGDLPVLQPNVGNCGGALRMVMNMARSIREFDASTLRRTKSMAMLRLLASQALSKMDRLHFDWPRVESLIFLIRPPATLEFAAGLRRARGNNATYAIGILKTASGELSRFLTTTADDLAIARRRYQAEQKPWLVSVFQVANHVLRGGTRVKRYSISKLKELSRNTGRVRRRGRFYNLDHPEDTNQSETLAQLFRGSERPLSVGPELRRRTAALVQKRFSPSFAPISSRPSEQDTAFSLYRGFDLPGTAVENGSSE